MAGHSRWSNIKHTKAAADAKKAAVAAKLSKFITVAVQVGGSPKPEDNPRLRLAIEKARAANMTMEAIERAIKKASGQLGGGPMDEVAYEGYAKGGVAVVVSSLTDNRHRTAPEIKKIFERAGGAVGAPGCVAWQFKPRALFLVERTSEDAVMEALLAADADAQDITAEDDGAVAIAADPAQFDAIGKALAAAKLHVLKRDIRLVPENLVEVADAAMAAQVQELIDALDDHDDVQDVAHNMA